MRATDPVAAMLALNPWLPSWAAGTSLWPLAGSSEEAVIVARRKQATAQRLAGGAGVWNGWANGMVSLVGPAAASPGLLRAWRELAAADFSGATFEDEFDCTALMFPGAVNFAGASFTAVVQGTNFPDRADFSRCVFGREAFFENCEFSGPAVFAGATFTGEARFTYSRFLAAADFANARFRKAAWFRYGSFAGAVRFSGATFARDVGLGSCTFGAESDFGDADFVDTASFEDTAFRGPTRFDAARFEGKAMFARAQFEAPVSFAGTRFGAEMDFTNIKIGAAATAVRDQIDELRQRTG